MIYCFQNRLVDAEIVVTENCFSLNFEPSTQSKMKLVVEY